MIFGAVVVGQSAIFTSDYQKAKIAAGNIFRLVDRQPQIKNANNTLEESPPYGRTSQGTVTLRGVHFSYPTRPEAKILQGLSLKAEKGQTVALVGSSGCGKSTCIQLLERFYDCAKGELVIRVDLSNCRTQF